METFLVAILGILDIKPILTWEKLNTQQSWNTVFTWVFNFKNLMSCTSEQHSQKFFVRVFHGNLHLRGASAKVKITDMYHSVVLTFGVAVCHLLSTHVHESLAIWQKSLALETNRFNLSLLKHKTVSPVFQLENLFALTLSRCIGHHPQDYSGNIKQLRRLHQIRRHWENYSHPFFQWLLRISEGNLFLSLFIIYFAVVIIKKMWSRYSEKKLYFLISRDTAHGWTYSWRSY